MSEWGINLSSIISAKTLHKNETLIEEAIENDPSITDERNDLMKKLILEEFDYTHSGSLTKLEYDNLMSVVNKELKAHKQFVGSNLKTFGQYVAGRTLGFGRTSICKIAFKKDDPSKQLYALKIYHITNVNSTAIRVSTDRRYCQ